MTLTIKDLRCSWMRGEASIVFASDEIVTPRIGRYMWIDIDQSDRFGFGGHLVSWDRNSIDDSPHDTGEYVYTGVLYDKLRYLQFLGYPQNTVYNTGQEAIRAILEFAEINNYGTISVSFTGNAWTGSTKSRFEFPAGGSAYDALCLVAQTVGGYFHFGNSFYSSVLYCTDNSTAYGFTDIDVESDLNIFRIATSEEISKEIGTRAVNYSGRKKRVVTWLGGTIYTKTATAPFLSATTLAEVAKDAATPKQAETTKIDKVFFVEPKEFTRYDSEQDESTRYFKSYPIEIEKPSFVPPNSASTAVNYEKPLAVGRKTVGGTMYYFPIKVSVQNPAWVPEDGLVPKEEYDQRLANGEQVYPEITFEEEPALLWKSTDADAISDDGINAMQSLYGSEWSPKTEDFAAYEAIYLISACTLPDREKYVVGSQTSDIPTRTQYYYYDDLFIVEAGLSASTATITETNGTQTYTMTAITGASIAEPVVIYDNTDELEQRGIKNYVDSPKKRVSLSYPVASSYRITLLPIYNGINLTSTRYGFDDVPMIIADMEYNHNDAMITIEAVEI